VLICVFVKQKLVVEFRPKDFSRLRRRLAIGVSSTTLFNGIGRARVVFNDAWDEALIERSVRYGQGFRKPTQKTLCKTRARRGAKLFKANELRAIIGAAGQPLRAMIYLGINCGLGNTDCMLLPLSAVADGWLDFPRPKTGIERRMPLWPETLEALEEALAQRPTPCREAEGRMFVTKYQNTWDPKSTTDNPISKEFRKVLDALNLYRPKVGFYALRHTFQTIGAMTLDKDAVRYIMGHVNDPQDMSAVYNETCPSDERLKKVTDFVRDWLRSTRLPKDRAEVDAAELAALPIAEDSPRLHERLSSEVGDAWRY
jgi:integrase